MFRSPFTELSVEPAQLQLLQHSRGNAPGDCHRARVVAEPSVMPIPAVPTGPAVMFSRRLHIQCWLWQHVKGTNLRYAAPQSLSADNSDYGQLAAPNTATTG